MKSQNIYSSYIQKKQDLLSHHEIEILKLPIFYLLVEAEHIVIADWLVREITVYRFKYNPYYPIS